MKDRGNLAEMVLMTEKPVVKPVAPSDALLERDIERVVRGLRPRAVLGSFLFSWAAMGVIGGLGSILGSNAFEPSLHWAAVIAVGSGITATAVSVVRRWHLSGSLTMTNVEIRVDVESDWALLTGPRWPQRMLGFGLVTAVSLGGVMGTLLAWRFPDEFGGTLATAGAMAGMLLIPVISMVFGLRALVVRQITRRAEHDVQITAPANRLSATEEGAIAKVAGGRPEGDAG